MEFALNFEMRLLVRKPQREVFERLTEPKNMLKWIPQLERFSIKDQDGEISEGSEFEQVIRHGGKRKVFQGTFEVYKPHRRLKVDIQTKHYQAQTTYFLREEPLGTAVKVVTTFIPKHLPMKLLGRMFAGLHQRQLASDLNRFKAFVEAESSDSEVPPNRREE